ncbi:MAG TPA: WYL domain-containing protein [Ktedonobacteraceae bacterium]|jgi:predicted DNA-binding transcriptional regulator YafY|nr:WYL domain-containing protein [Ktedonobacteraceae bacterium]
MNRIDRLTAILLLLQGGKRTAGEIAGRFEVSRRTILRDIQSLCEMGIPIVADLGASGGYTLMPDYSLPPLALTLHEALLLRLALSSLSQLAETPFPQERESLLAKVQTLIPQRSRPAIDQFEQALSLDLPLRTYQTPFLDQLLESARAQQWLSVTYRSERGVSQQTILPMRLYTSTGFWYCEAYSYERCENRRYRVDRFLAVRIAQSPPQTNPAPSGPLPYGHPSLPEVRIHLTARGVLMLERDPYLGPCIQQRDEEGGWLCERFRLQDYDWLVRVIIGLATEVKVLAPETLRLRVQQQILLITHHHAEL